MNTFFYLYLHNKIEYIFLFVSQTMGNSNSNLQRTQEAYFETGEYVFTEYKNKYLTYKRKFQGLQQNQGSHILKNFYNSLIINNLILIQIEMSKITNKTFEAQIEKCKQICYNIKVHLIS